MGDLTTWFEQAGYQVRFDWGQDGAARAGARGDVVVIVDTLRFSTTVAAHLAAGAMVEPRHWKEGSDTSLLSPSSRKPREEGSRLRLPHLMARCAVGRRASRGQRRFLQEHWSMQAPSQRRHARFKCPSQS